MMTEKSKAYDIALGKRLRAARTACGLSQQNVGDHFGLTFQQIQKYEKGMNRISSDKVVEWGKMTGFSLSYLLDISDKEINMNIDDETKIILSAVRAFKPLSVTHRNLVLSLMKSLSKAA